jgi:hypothetical protein
MAIQFTVNEVTTLVKSYNEFVDGQYVFKFDKIAPNDILDKIDASLVILGDDGETVVRILDKKDDYSVAQYAIDLKEQAVAKNDEKTLNLLRDLVWYCCKAEEYADGTANIYGLLGGRFDEGTMAPTEADNAFELDNALTTGSRFTAAGVFFSVDNKIYVKINAEETVKLVVKKGDEVVQEVSFEAGKHTCYTDGILATDFDEVYTFELYIGESTTAAQTLAYSINSYAYRMMTHSTNEAMVELACALYGYGKSAEAFIAD